jgi:hypothetical protein
VLLVDCTAREQKVGTYLFTLDLLLFSLPFVDEYRSGALSFDDQDFPNFLDGYDPDVAFIDALENVPFQDDEFPDLSQPDLNESGVSGVLLKRAAFAGASGVLAKPFSSSRNIFDDTGNDDLILDMSMDNGVDFNTSSRSKVQESSRNLISAPIPTGAGSTAA